MAEVGIATIRRLEVETGEIRGAAQTIWKIQTALEKAGVRFIAADDHGGVGVRLYERI